jgi:hypothetical protein
VLSCPSRAFLPVTCCLARHVLSCPSRAVLPAASGRGVPARLPGELTARRPSCRTRKGTSGTSSCAMRAASERSAPRFRVQPHHPAGSLPGQRKSVPPTGLKKNRATNGCSLLSKSDCTLDGQSVLPGNAAPGRTGTCEHWRCWWRHLVRVNLQSPRCQQPSFQSFGN